MINLMRTLWPINRSLSGEGNRQTLTILSEFIGENLEISRIPSGSEVFDWTIPKEWNVNEAYVIRPDGIKILNFHQNNLHLVGYSDSVDKIVSLNELQDHLFSLPNQPDAVPYVTSYYRNGWGFCISEKDRLGLPEGDYRVVIRTTKKDGFLELAEFLIPGECKDREIIFSTYICHPSLANNELSGPVLCAALIRELKSLYSKSKPHYSVRFLFLPETIGAIAYINKNLELLRHRTIAGFVVTCVGDDRSWSFVPSRLGNTLADRVARRSLAHLGIRYKEYPWLERGSDERQFCSPGVDLPFCSIMRSKYGTYPEYHTSMDRIDTVVTESGLNESFSFYLKLIEECQNLVIPELQTICEPQMSKRNLYPTTSIKDGWIDTRNNMNVLSFCDGKTELEEIAKLSHLDAKVVQNILHRLQSYGLVDF
jgi:aminopeptidase-like protein